MSRNFLGVFPSFSNCNASQPVTHEGLILHSQGGDNLEAKQFTHPPALPNPHLHLPVGLGNLCTLTYY